VYLKNSKESFGGKVLLLDCQLVRLQDKGGYVVDDFQKSNRSLKSSQFIVLSSFLYADKYSVGVKFITRLNWSLK